jgi:hypothetical protein
LCGALKKVAAGSIVFRWTDRADAVDHATAWSAPHKDGYLPGFLGLRRLAAEPFFKLAAQWVAAMVPALILLSEDRERASVVLMALVGTAWAAHAGTATLEDQAFNRAYGRWLALLLLGSAFSVVFGSGDIQLAIWYEWIFWWLAAWLAYRSGRLIISTRYFGVVLAGVGILFGILAVWQKIAGYGDVAGWMPAALRPTVGARAIGFFGNPNVFAAAVNLVLWPLAALLIESAGRRMPLRKGTYAVGLAGLILALLLTWSRAALLGAIGAAVILMVMTPKATAFHRTKARPGFWIAIGAAMVLIVTFLTPLGIGAGGAAGMARTLNNLARSARTILAKSLVRRRSRQPVKHCASRRCAGFARPQYAAAMAGRNGTDPDADYAVGYHLVWCAGLEKGPAFVTAMRIYCCDLCHFDPRFF